MENTAPLEVVAAPWELYIAPLDTTFPALDEEPESPWVKVGTEGNLNHFPDGIIFDQSQSTEVFRSAGSTGPRKIVRMEEDQKVGLTIADLTLEQYAHALNENTVTETEASAGVPGSKKIGLSRGHTVATRALLIRGPSPYMEDGVAQYEIPRAAQTGSPKPALKNGEPFGLALEWTTLVDPNAATADEQFGRFVAQTEEAST